MMAFSSGVIIRLRFSGPAITRKPASSSSCLPIACFLLRAARLATECVDLVEEDDAGRVLLRMPEEVAHPRRADADEHLDEVGAAQRKVGDLCLARHGARQQRLAGAGWTDQQDPARHARP